MKLHNDKDAFLAILQRINEATGIRADILEKDYYVTLMLKQLADKQDSLPAYFKGGTALYKALGTIQRFSEDIDLTVRIDDCSKTQAKRRLEKAAQDYTSLVRTGKKDLEHNRKGSISCAYDYEPVVDVPSDDALQRFGHVRVEATSFTVSEPISALIIAPALHEQASDDQRDILAASYNVEPFTVETIGIERIFVDKIFAAEFYYERQEYFDVAKHLYDIAVMFRLDAIQNLLANEAHLQDMIAYKREEEAARIGSDLADKSFVDFLISKDISKNADLEQAFNRMQEVYVFDDTYLIEFQSACSTLTEVLFAMSGDGA